MKYFSEVRISPQWTICIWLMQSENLAFIVTGVSVKKILVNFFWQCWCFAKDITYFLISKRNNATFQWCILRAQWLRDTANELAPYRSLFGIDEKLGLLVKAVINNEVMKKHYKCASAQFLSFLGPIYFTISLLWGFSTTSRKWSSTLKQSLGRWSHRQSVSDSDMMFRLLIFGQNRRQFHSLWVQGLEFVSLLWLLSYSTVVRIRLFVRISQVVELVSRRDEWFVSLKFKLWESLQPRS